MRTVHVHPHEITRRDGSLYSAATIESGSGSQDIWFSTPEDSDIQPPLSHDHLLLAALFSGMTQGERIVLHGTAHPALLANLEEFSAIWNCWRPEIYRTLAIEAESTSKPAAGRDGYVFAFSGGVDACSTLWRHTHEGMGNRRKPVRRAILVHGFDIPLDQSAGFEIAYARSKAITQSVDVPLIPVRTNVRSLVDAGIRWEDAFGAFVAATLVFAGGDCTGGVLSSDEPYAYPELPWGSNPISNHFLGSSEFSITTDGAELGRLEKVQTLKDWPEALQNLRVCWEGDVTGQNCGRCEKCVRTLLELVISGVHDSAAFPSALKPGQVKRTRLRNPVQLSYFTEAYKQLPDNAKGEWWARELRSAVKRGVVKPSYIRRIRSRIALRTRLDRALHFGRERLK